MIEQLAKALFDASEMAREGDQEKCGQWEEMDICTYIYFTDMARTAITALRNPPGEVFETAFLKSRGVSAAEFYKAYQLMLDAAMEADG